ncbi:MAG: hypothetical protein WDM81_09895 [Rhizomicrobium sp.]
MRAARAVLTDPDLPSGSDRIFQALTRLDPQGEHDVVVNLQGRSAGARSRPGPARRPDPVRHRRGYRDPGGRDRRSGGLRQIPPS